MRIVLMLMILVSLKLLSAAALAGELGSSYICTFENQYMQGKAGALHRTEDHPDYGERFSVNSDGVRTGYLDGQYEVYRLGDAEGWSWQGKRKVLGDDLDKILDPKGYQDKQLVMRISKQRSLPATLTIHEWKEGKEKPYIQWDSASVETGRCVNF